MFQGAEGIFEKLGVERTYISCLSPNFDNLPAGTETYVGQVLYEILQDEDENLNQKQDKEDKPSGKAKAPNLDQTTKYSHAQNEFEMMDIRVGLIEKAWHHESADTLFCELIGVGEDKPRQIASGLRKFYKLEDLENRKVLVVCNLKAAKLKGFSSHGMVLCASSPEAVEFIDPPNDSKVGERVFLEGTNHSTLPAPLSASQVTRKKIFQKVGEDLQTNERCEAIWKNKRLLTSAGVCSAKTLQRVKIK